MNRVRLLLLLNALLLLAVPAVLLAQEKGKDETKDVVKVEPRAAVIQMGSEPPGQVVYLANPIGLQASYDRLIYALVALSAVNAALLAVVWSQLSAMRGVLEKQSSAPKV
jgi:hypothetical protein